MRHSSVIAALALTVLSSGCGGSGTTPSTPTHSTTQAVHARVTAPFSYGVHPRISRFIGNITMSNCSSSTQCATPTAIRTGYSFPSTLSGSGKSIMIVDAYGSPTAYADAKQFWSDAGLPVMATPSPSGACAHPCLTFYYPGGSPTFNPNASKDVTWAEETSLDLQWAHAAAPGADIAMIVSANEQGDAIKSAQEFAVTNVRGDVLSMSFGTPEYAINGGANNTQVTDAEVIYTQALAQHITIVSSVGDFGALGGGTAVNSQFPADDPRVLAVGGTNLILYHNGSYRNESVWDDATGCLKTCTLGADGATGGAPSIFFPAPVWQVPTIQGYNATSSVQVPLMRTPSDVSYNASPNTGVAVYLGFGAQVPTLGQNGYYAVGGTSQGPPQWAGIIATADAARGSDLGCINASLYNAPAATKATILHDVTNGNNQFPAGAPGYNAGVGWDPPTGWGSPIVSPLISWLTTLVPQPC